MKRLIVTICLGILAMASSICSAAIPQSELALGGITLSSSVQNARAVYGEPTRTETRTMPIWGRNVQFRIYYFGNGSFYVIEADRDEIGIVTVMSDAANGIATPAGITVGMRRDAMLRTYGSPDAKYNNSDGSVSYTYRDNRKGRMPDELQFNVRNGKIIRIKLDAGILSI